MGGRDFSDENQSNAELQELARARRIAEALTGAGDRAIVEAYIRELSARAALYPENDLPFGDAFTAGSLR